MTEEKIKYSKAYNILPSFFHGIIPTNKISVILISTSLKLYLISDASIEWVILLFLYPKLLNPIIILKKA